MVVITDYKILEKKCLYKFDELGKVRNDLNVCLVLCFTCPIWAYYILVNVLCFYRTEKILDEE